MRRAFTLVELLVVVVVIVTLMAITFRLGSVGSTSTLKSITVNRMQRLENCLSGYYAAYGSYPPVALHGSRDYTYSVDRNGIQRVGRGSGGGTHESTLNWRNVEAACRSQPVGYSFPYASRDIQDYVKSVSDMLMEKANSSEERYAKFRENESLKIGFMALNDNSIVRSDGEYKEWTRTQVFKLGLMSYLLPRLLVALDVPSGDRASSGFKQLFSDQKQWTMNNDLPCDFATGMPYGSWDAVISDYESKANRWKIAALPSQTICTRWMPNLEGAVSGRERTVYGINIHDSHSGVGGVTADTTNPELYSAGDSQAGSGVQYLLDGLTVKDGWHRELYYYSPSPHQSYTLWSAGENGKTFPPWVTDEELANIKEKSTVQAWIADDIVHMRN